MVEQGVIRGYCLHKGKLGFNHSHFVFNTYVACMLFFLLVILFYISVWILIPTEISSSVYALTLMKCQCKLLFENVKKCGE